MLTALLNGLQIVIVNQLMKNCKSPFCGNDAIQLKNRFISADSTFFKLL